MMKKIGVLLLTVMVTWCSFGLSGKAAEIERVEQSMGIARFTYTYLAYAEFTKDNSGLGLSFYLDGHSDVTKINVYAVVKKDGKEVKIVNKTVNATSMFFDEDINTDNNGNGTYTMSGSYTVYGKDGGSETIRISDSINY